MAKNDAECVTEQVTDSVTSQTKWLLCIGSMEVRSWELVRAVSPSADTCHWFKGIKESECVKSLVSLIVTELMEYKNGWTKLEAL